MSQSNSPRVCAVMLVNGRQAMVERAVRSFREQTYRNKWLLIWDTGELNRDFEEGDGIVAHIPAEANRDPAPTIGNLRNEANAFRNVFRNKHDIICHWDSDDWSHPRRIEEQVALLQASRKECVGYRDMLFWDSREDPDVPPYESYAVKPGAWLYSNNDPRYCLGTSLCYWRRVWEARPFPDEPKHRGGIGEDVKWLEDVDSLGVSSIGLHIVPDSDWKAGEVREVNRVLDFTPLMIASIHGGNSQSYDVVVGQSPSWRLAPEWDTHCRERMAL